MIRVNDYSLPAPAGKIGEKISFDKREIIVNLGKILTDRKTVRKKEIAMFSVSEKASEMIKEFLKNRTEAASIRVLMQEGG
jgi:ribosomal protein L18E